MGATRHKVTSDTLYAQLEQAIVENRVGERLPTINQLCAQYGTSHCTLKRVLDRLKSRHYIVGHRGKCLFVNKNALGNPLFQKNIVFYFHPSTMLVPYYLKIYILVRRLLQDSGCQIHLVNSAEQLECLAAPPAVVILSEIYDAREQAQIERLADRKRIVKLNEISPDCRAIGTDNFAGGHQAAAYLYSRGHRAVGVVARDVGDAGSFFNDRFNGFMAFAREAGDMRVSHVAVDAMPGGRSPSLALALDQWLAKRPAPTAVFAFTDLLALGVYQHCATRGVAVPGDVSILGFDDSQFSALLSPALTTFQEDCEAVAGGLVEMFHAVVRNRPIESRFLPPRLVERASVRSLSALRALSDEAPDYQLRQTHAAGKKSTGTGSRSARNSAKVFRP